MAVGREMFKHDDPRQGHVKTIVAHPYTENGRRQEYRYIIEYYGGDVKAFDMKCPSLPFSITRDDLLQRIGFLTRQSFSKSFFKHKDTIISNIRRILRHRGKFASAMPSWDTFFSCTMPQSLDEDFNFSGSIFHRLVTEFGGPIQLPVRDQHDYVIPIGPYDYVDPIVFNLGPVKDEAGNDKILRDLGLPPLVKRKRKKKKMGDRDDSDSNTDDSDEDRDTGEKEDKNAHKKVGRNKVATKKIVPKNTTPKKRSALQTLQHNRKKYVKLSSFDSDEDYTNEGIGIDSASLGDRKKSTRLTKSDADSSGEDSNFQQSASSVKMEKFECSDERTDESRNDGEYKLVV